MDVKSPVNGTKANQWGGSTRTEPLLTILRQLRACQGAWCPQAPWDREAAHAALLAKPAGSFLVLGDSETSQPCLLCVSAGVEHEPGVLDYHIKHTGTALQLSQSRLCFADLAQLVFFYSLTRDVLSVRLYIPSWLHSITRQSDTLFSQLRPESWYCEPSVLPTDPMTDMMPSIVMCSIQLTSVNGALCVINPLYLHEHGDNGLTHQPTSSLCSKQSISYSRERRKLSSSRPWSGAGLNGKRTISLEQEYSTEYAGLIRAQSFDSTPWSPATNCTLSSTASVGVILRQPSRDGGSCPLSQTGSTSGSSTSGSSTSGPSPVADPQQHTRSLLQSPHRASWVEDGVWLDQPQSCAPLLQPPFMELDTLSISSIEEEQESLVPSPSSQHPSAHRLANKVKNRISAVGQAIGGLLCPEKRLTYKVLELSEKRGGVFSDALGEFVEATLKGGVDPSRPMGSEFLQEVRSSLTTLRETLLDCPEIQAIVDSMVDTSNYEIDAMLESSLHKVALKPVSAHLYSTLQAARCHDGSLPSLRGNQRVLEERGVEELGGTVGAGVPDAPTLERLQQRWSSMHAAYSPSRKVNILLKVCKSIYHSMSTNASPGSVFGADDFLPCLTWVLLRSNTVTLQLDTDYMMELLDPSQLQGEGGYYLTSLYASLYYISSFRPQLAVRQLSVEAQLSLKKWHRRRTLYCDQSRRSKHRRTLRRQTNRTSSANFESQQESESKEIISEQQTSPSSGMAESQQQADKEAEAQEPMRENEEDNQSELPTVPEEHPI